MNSVVSYIPPECDTDELKTAFCFGWWKSLEVNRKEPLYKEMDDWLDEIENYGTRYERLLDAFPAQYVDREMLMLWLQAAWECARMKKDEQ